MTRIVCLILAGLLFAAPASAKSTFTIRGAGFGHGVGMSQYGAMGYASHGWDYKRILGHYYTDTGIGVLNAWYHLGVDGISMPLIVLTAFTTPLVVIAAWGNVEKRPSQYFASFLVMEGLMIGVFSGLVMVIRSIRSSRTFVPAVKRV